ncbi:MAG: YraN family protein [Bauldia sp.]|nr:YraN family protein [Bauldia sp.]
MARRVEADPLRQRAERSGRWAESLAAWYLRARFYRILARRYRTPAGEVDLIARRGRTIVFVEVKQRPTETEAIEAVRPAARRRIARAAEHWIASHPGALGFDRRFDVIAVLPGRGLRHLKAVFDVEGRPW